MKLSNIEFLKLIPQFMREDDAVRGLAAAIDKIVPGIAESVGKLSTWDRIDELSEKELDELAWELNIPWYDSAASLAIKREVVKNSDKVYKRIGTKWAVENIIKTYFGDGYILEWFEYDGEPGHFRVYSSNPSLNNERLTEFLALLNKTKRASAKLDGISITLDAELVLSTGVALHEVSNETYAIGAVMPA
jgi:phage tail P2-like protein